MQDRSNQYRISYTSVVCMALLLCFFPPPVLSYLPGLDTLLDIAKFAASGYMLVLVFAKSKPTPVAVMGVLFYLFLVAATFFNRENVITAIKSVLPHVAFLLYADYMLTKYPRTFVKSFAGLMKVYIVVNLLMLIILPDGVGRFIPDYNYLGANSRLSLLGLDNNYIKLFIPATVAIYFSCENNRIQRNFYFLLMFGTLLYVWSGTGVCCIAILMAYIFLLENTWIDRMIGYYRCFIVAVIAYAGTVSSGLIRTFSSLIENVLGKSITLSGRTFLWSQALKLIAQKPILGYGVLDGSLLYSPTNGHAYSAHNTALQILLQGGVLALVIFAAFILMAGMALKKSVQTKASVESGYGLMCVAMFAFFIVGIFEILVFSSPLLLMVMMVGHYEDIKIAFSVKENNK